jgi:hypothetical protein
MNPSHNNPVSHAEALLKAKNVAAGEHLTGNLDFFTVETATDLTAAANLNKMVETISLNGQPVIMGAVTGTGPYTLKFANEHTAAWTAASLDAALEAAGFANCVVTAATGL